MTRGSPNRSVQSLGMPHAAESAATSIWNPPSSGDPAHAPFALTASLCACYNRGSRRASLRRYEMQVNVRNHVTANQPSCLPAV